MMKKGAKKRLQRKEGTGKYGRIEVYKKKTENIKRKIGRGTVRRKSNRFR